MFLVKLFTFGILSLSVFKIDYSCVFWGFIHHPLFLNLCHIFVITSKTTHPMSSNNYFCVACEALRHIRITLSVVRPSVCPSVCHTFLSHFPKLCFAGDTCISRKAVPIFDITFRCFTLIGLTNDHWWGFNTEMRIWFIIAVLQF